ncbi:MAG: prolyl oligopeptidase family serine peptidase [Chitinophagales bacterium]
MQNNKYPFTKKESVKDTYFGKEIEDPYRWLENDISEETKKWVAAQNKFTQAYLQKLPNAEKIKARLSAVWNFEKNMIPFKKGKYLYCFKNSGVQNQNILYRENEEGIEELVLDPNTFSEHGTDSLGIIKFSKNNKYLAYKISEGGSDWGRVVVMDLKTKQIIEENVLDIKFSDISWLGDEGFYYSSYKLDTGSKLSAKTDRHFMFYHKLFTPQNEDEIVYGADEKYRYVNGGITEDERFLIVYAANNTSSNQIFCRDLTKKSEIVELTNFENNYSYVISSKGEDLIILTNKDAPNNKIIKVNVNKPDVWQDIIPEDISLENASTAGGYIFVSYLKDVNTLIKQYDYEGNFIKEINLEKQGTIIGFNGNIDDEETYFQFTNNTTPISTYKYNLKTEEAKLFWKPKVDVELNNLVSKQVFYTSKDGTKIPMTISHKKGVKLNGKNPSILYGYGGFTASLRPYFSIINSVWLEMGGVYAVANLRGGGEYGRAWHDAGIKMKKQNVFDDFIAAAEFLIAEKYTSSKHLALKGGSNGGLLVGAVMLQKPNLFQVALPAVGVLDMLRYHKFTSGAGWSYDYGTSEDSIEMFAYLLNYSPLHNVKENVNYPATLITTGDHDDRVVPAHSFKFAATLQNKNKENKLPLLIRIETDAGHGAGKSTEKLINENADILSFTWHYLTKS